MESPHHNGEATLSVTRQYAGWTNERRRIAKAMWANGSTFGEIAAYLGPGTTRNAVGGYLYRCGLLTKKLEQAGRPLTEQEIGQRCRYSVFAFENFRGQLDDREGEFLGFNRRSGWAKVRWDGNKCESHYHPDIIEIVPQAILNQ